MTLLSAQSLSFDNTFGPLLAGISFGLKKGDRIGLIGHNGCGKSTLLKILSGDLDATSGTLTRSNQCLMARVEQHLPDELHDCTLLDAVLNHLPDSLHQPERWQAEVLLVSLGFDEASWMLTAGTLSGGQHTRLLLARALIRQPDLLLLDEPSNHLDLPTLLWLEQFLKNWSGSFVLVSHNRSLLDNVTNSTWILRDKTLQFIRLPCTQARQALEDKDAADALRRRAEQKEIDRVVKSGNRIALVGRNGCGKSSLLHRLWRAFCQPESTEPGVVFHPKVRVGYYDQSLHQLLDEDTLSEALAPFALLTEDQRKIALIGAGFPYVRHQQKVSTLSGGERSRLLFIGLTLANYSLLLLDEPTNHLDMEGKEELAETLKTFSGAVLLVSHDHTLIEQSCNRFWLINKGQMEEWHDLAPVYAILADISVPATLAAPKQSTGSRILPETEEERLLATLLELESKLEEDLSRKVRHQKPELQRQWQQQIAQLSALLDLG